MGRCCCSLACLAAAVAVAGCLAPIEPQPARAYPYPGQRWPDPVAAPQPQPPIRQPAVAPTPIPSNPTTTQPPLEKPAPKPYAGGDEPLTPAEQAEVLDWQGRKARVQSNFEEAVTKGERAVQIAPQNPAYALNLAKTYVASGRYDDGITVARKAMAMSGAKRDVQIDAAITSGDALRNCLNAKKKRCGSDPGLGDAEVERLAKQGQTMLTEKRVEEALAIFLRAYALSGKPRPLLSIAKLEYVGGSYTEALLHARWVRFALPKSATKLAAEQEELIEAIVLECEKREDNCRREWEPPATKPAKIGTTPRSTEAALVNSSTSDPEVQTKRGNEALAADNYQAAIEAFERAASLDPKNAKYAFNLAVVYRVYWRYEKSIAIAQRVLSMPTADRDLKIEAAVLAGDTIHQCNGDGKYSTCKLDSSLTADEIERLDKEGQALVQAKRPDEALPVFLRAYAFSGNAKPLLRIATFEYVTGHYKDALQHARRVRDSVPEKTSGLRKETDELIRVILADCKQAKADCRGQ